MITPAPEYVATKVAGAGLNFVATINSETAGARRFIHGEGEALIKAHCSNLGCPGDVIIAALGKISVRGTAIVIMGSGDVLV